MLCFMSEKDDLKWMRRALSLAKKAEAKDEVPVAAIVVKDGKYLAQAYNLRESLHSAIAHAEILALHRAGQKIGNWQLQGCDVYVTLEPCLMCASALSQARVRRVIFGAWDRKRGGLGGYLSLHQDQNSNHHFEVTGGLLESDCSQWLKDFFKNKRS